MIHYLEVRPTPAPAVVPAPSHPTRRWPSPRAVLGSAVAAVMLVSLARSLGAQNRPVARAAADTAAPARPSYNWLSDRRSFSVGDILKVNVDEYALATANKEQLADASRKRSMDVGISPPSTGAASAAIGPIDGSVGTSDAGQSRQRGTASRGTRYVGELPVRVIAVTKEGLLQVRGTKLIDVDKNKQEMTLTGFVRPQDVNSLDEVASTSIADAQLAYKSKGGLGKPRNGIISKILGIFWP